MSNHIQHLDISAIRNKNKCNLRNLTLMGDQRVVVSYVKFTSKVTNIYVTVIVCRNFT